MQTSLIFQSTTFDVVDRNGDVWLRGHQIGVALGYSRTDIIQKLYRKHADEFTEDMTAVVKLPTEGGEQDVRIFSPRGCYALAMFARTKVAKEFRRWVLDVLESIRKTGQYIAAPITPAQQSELQAIVATIDPDGKKRGGIWTRFNRHFHIAKYSQLPQSKFDEAMQYLADRFLGGEYIPASEPEAIDIDALATRELTRPGRRFIAVFRPDPINGGIQTVMQSVPEDARVLTNKEIIRCVSEHGEFPRSLLPDLIRAAATRLAA